MVIENIYGRDKMNIIKYNGTEKTYTMDDGSIIPQDTLKEYLLQKKQGKKVNKAIKKAKRKYTRRKKREV